MIRALRFLACLAALTLALSGGLYTHAANAHDHYQAQSVAQADDDGHQHAKNDLGGLDHERALHCGAFVLILAAEYGSLKRVKTKGMPRHVEHVPHPAFILFDTPPPRKLS